MPAFPPTLRPWLTGLAALIALLGSAGCVGSGGTETKDLPPDWLAAVPKSGTPARDLEGVFVELGEQLDARYTRDGTVGRANLSTFFSSRTLSLNGGWVRRPPDRGATVELRRVDDTHLELITKVNGAVESRVTLEVEFEKDTGTMLLHRDRSPAKGGELLATGRTTLTTRFWHAADGRLYAQSTRHDAGVVLVVPVNTSFEFWTRWDPATPEGLRRQAAVLAKQADTSARAAELNRNRPAVGAPVPAFAGTDVLTGRAVSSNDFAGKVTVLHAWATGSGSRPLKPLHTVYAKYRARGLAMIGLCLNRANEREKIAAFIQSNALTWPQLYDGQETHGGIFEAYYGTQSGWQFCVIDRHGNLAAFVRTADELAAAVAAALAAP